MLTPPVDETFRIFEQRYGVPTAPLKAAMAEVGRRYGTDSMGPLDIPLVDEPTWARLIEAEMLKSHGLTVDLGSFGERWFDDRPANRDWIDYLATLRGHGVYVGMLSNMPPAWEPLWRQMVSEDLFDGVVCSHAVGHRKPDPDIFLLAADISAIPPEQCVLVDDVARNCDGAVAAGWHAIHFTAVSTAQQQVDCLLAGSRPIDSH